MVFIFEKEANYSVIQYCNFFHIVEGDFSPFSTHFSPTEHMSMYVPRDLCRISPQLRKQSHDLPPGGKEEKEEEARADGK